LWILLRQRSLCLHDFCGDDDFVVVADMGVNVDVDVDVDVDVVADSDSDSDEGVADGVVAAAAAGFVGSRDADGTSEQWME